MAEHNRALRAARERMPSRSAPGEHMTRAELAEAVNRHLWDTTGRRFELDDHLIGKWERGVVRCPIREYRAALRDVLGVGTDSELGFRAPAHRAVPAASRGPASWSRDDVDAPDALDLGDTDEVNRRELMRLFSMTGATLALPADTVDVERMHAVSVGKNAFDSTVVDDFARLNSHLWQVYGLTPQKKSMLPLVRDQLGVLCDGLNWSSSRDRPRICALVSDLYQLTGEVLFDGDSHVEAAQCYLLASTAAQEAKAYDLWAAAMTRHAFIAVFGQQLDKALPMLDLASGIAQRGDSELTTRYWVAAVRAEVSAGIGDGGRCERDLDTAAEVASLVPAKRNAGWLRFDEARLPEQRGTCMVALGRLDAAEVALTEALSRASTARRRASVQTDLALVNAQRRDHRSVVMWLDDAISAARATRSAYIIRKLCAARAALAPLTHDPHIRRVDVEIRELGRSLNDPIR